MKQQREEAARLAREAEEAGEAERAKAGKKAPKAKGKPEPPDSRQSPREDSPQAAMPVAIPTYEEHCNKVAQDFAGLELQPVIQSIEGEGHGWIAALDLQFAAVGKRVCGVLLKGEEFRPLAIVFLEAARFLSRSAQEPAKTEADLLAQIKSKTMAFEESNNARESELAEIVHNIQVHCSALMSLSRLCTLSVGYGPLQIQGGQQGRGAGVPGVLGSRGAILVGTRPQRRGGPPPLRTPNLSHGTMCFVGARGARDFALGIRGKRTRGARGAMRGVRAVRTVWCASFF